MRHSLLKPIVVGVIIGALLFTMPFFLLKAAIFILVAGWIIRMFAWRRMGGGYGHRFGFADRIRSMSEEEYNAFKARYEGGCYGRRSEKNYKTRKNDFV